MVGVNQTYDWMDEKGFGRDENVHNKKTIHVSPKQKNKYDYHNTMASGEGDRKGGGKRRHVESSSSSSPTVDETEVRFDGMLVRLISSWARVVRADAKDKSLIQQLPSPILVNVVFPFLNYDDRGIWSTGYSIAKKLVQHHGPRSPVALRCDGNDWRYFCDDRFDALCEWLTPAKKSIKHLHMKHIFTMLFDTRPTVFRPVRTERLLTLLNFFPHLTDVELNFHDPFYRSRDKILIEQGEWAAWFRTFRPQLKRFSLAVRQFGSRTWGDSRVRPAVRDALEQCDMEDRQKKIGEEIVWPLETFECPDLMWDSPAYRDSPLPRFPFGPRLHTLDLLLYIGISRNEAFDGSVFFDQLTKAAPSIKILRMRFCADFPSHWSNVRKSDRSPAWLARVVDAYFSTLEELYWVTGDILTWTEPETHQYPLLEQGDDVLPLVKCSLLRTLVLNLTTEFPLDRLAPVLHNNRKLVTFGCFTPLQKPTLMTLLAQHCPQLQRAALIHARPRTVDSMHQYETAWTALTACRGLRQLPDMHMLPFYPRIDLPVDAWKPIQQLQHLRMLSWPIPDAIRACRELRCLDIRGDLDHKILDAVAGSLPRLRHLWWSPTHTDAIGEESWKALANGCPQLQSIHIECEPESTETNVCRLMEADVDRLLKACPDLRWILVHHPALETNITTGFAPVRQIALSLVGAAGLFENRFFQTLGQRNKIEGRWFLLEELFESNE
jgi:hypothetical protein